MSRKFYKMSNAEFTIFVANLVTESNNNKTVLEFKQTDIDSLGNDNTEHNADLLLRQSIQDSLNSKNTTIKSRRRKMNKMVAKLQTDAENNENVSDSLLEQLGFDARNGNASSPAVSPVTNLVATGTSDRVNALKFNRNGNKQGTLFYIYAKIGNATEWILIDVITGTKYAHKNQTPGVKVQYCVKAKRGDVESASSNTAVVYE